MSIKQTEAEKLKTVILLKDHTHNGAKCAKDSSIQVNATDETWLIGQGIVADPSTATTEVAKK